MDKKLPYDTTLKSRANREAATAITERVKERASDRTRRWSDTAMTRAMDSEGDQAEEEC